MLAKTFSDIILVIVIIIIIIFIIVVTIGTACLVQRLGYGLYDRGIVVRFPAAATVVSSLQCAQTRSGAHLASY